MKKSHIFSVKACPWVQVLKVLGGLIVTVTVMELTKNPLDALFNGHLFRTAAALHADHF